MAGLSRPLQLINGLVTLLFRTLQPQALHAMHPFSSVPFGRESDAPRAAPGLGCSDFARRYSRNRYRFLFPPGTEMVHFPGFASTAYVFSGGFPGFAGTGFPIRKSSDQSLLAAPRGLSQLATSFIACLRQGIHRTPLVA